MLWCLSFVVNLDVSSESCTKGLCISTPNLKGSSRRSVLFFGEHGRLLFFRLKLHHVDATSRHVDFMSISNSDVLERGSYPSWMSIEVWNLIWMCTQDMYILCCLIPL